MDLKDLEVQEDSQEKFENAVRNGDFYAAKLHECINALESLIMADKFNDGAKQKERLQEWSRYHIKRLMNNFDINWSQTIRDFL